MHDWLVAVLRPRQSAFLSGGGGFWSASCVPGRFTKHGRDFTWRGGSSRKDDAIAVVCCLWCLVGNKYLGREKRDKERNGWSRTWRSSDSATTFSLSVMVDSNRAIRIYTHTKEGMKWKLHDNLKKKDDYFFVLLFLAAHFLLLVVVYTGINSYIIGTKAGRLACLRPL